MVYRLQDRAPRLPVAGEPAPRAIQRRRPLTAGAPVRPRRDDFARTPAVEAPRTALSTSAAGALTLPGLLAEKVAPVAVLTPSAPVMPVVHETAARADGHAVWFTKPWRTSGGPADNLDAPDGPLAKLGRLAAAVGGGALSLEGGARSTPELGLWLAKPVHPVEVEGVLFTPRDVEGLLASLAAPRELATKIDASSPAAFRAAALDWSLSGGAILVASDERGRFTRAFGAAEDTVFDRRPEWADPALDAEVDPRARREFGELTVHTADRSRSYRWWAAYREDEAVSGGWCGAAPEYLLRPAAHAFAWPDDLDGDLVRQLYDASLGA